MSGVMAATKSILDKMSGAISRTSGRPISTSQTTLLIVVAFYLIYRYVLTGTGVDAEGGGAYRAYTKGYNDGKHNRPFDAIEDVAPAVSGGGGGFGIGKLFSVAMAGSMIYQLGGQPFSLDNVVANARNMNPMNMVRWGAANCRPPALDHLWLPHCRASLPYTHPGIARSAPRLRR